MGYTTTFEGKFSLDEPLTEAQAQYLRQFSETRRMKRDAILTSKRPDPLREAVELPVGDEGSYFVGETGIAGQDRAPDILEYNHPPKLQPGLWCSWTVSPDNMHIEWDGSEKFYNYAEWLAYIIRNFLKPWGRTLTGEVAYQGENPSDQGTLRVVDNRVYK